MSYEIPRINEAQEQIDLLLVDIFSEKAEFPITFSKNGEPRVRGYFLDEDAGMAYFDANRFEGLARIEMDNGHFLFVAEKSLQSGKYITWYKYDTESQELYVRQAKAARRLPKIWSHVTGVDILPFRNLLNDFRYGHPFDDYESPATAMLTHDNLYQFTTPELQ